MAYLLQNRAERRRSHRRKSVALPWLCLSKKKKTSPTNDALGRPSTISYPDNRKSIYGYDANGNKTDDTEYGTDGTFKNTHTDYDSLNRPATVTYPDGGRQVTTYYPQGWVEDSIDENHNDTHSVYDAAGRKTTQTAGFGSMQAQETDYGYDANGNQTTLAVGGQLQSTTGYDSLNRATTVLYPQPSGEAMVGPSVTQLDADGRKISQTDLA